MSERRQISPLLDGCVVADAISDRNGIRCYPVQREATGECYTLKVISVPHSPAQVAALLLSGTCKNREEAAEYYLEAAKNVVREKIVLNNLSKAEGFFPFDFVQVEPLADGIGYDVYLMTPYCPSAERILLQGEPTHLQAMNLALDMCTALAACRRAGYIYVDLKPSNIFFTPEKGFRIGDLGFVALDTLQSTTLAQKYHSAYSPAEVKDPMAVLNTTVDTYALGMILYQIYNGGQLPAEGEPIAAPAFADYELAEIILKACAEDPAARWENPAALGRALVSYVQRNSINDTPIAPAIAETPAPEPEPSEAVEEFLPETAPDAEELAQVQEPFFTETFPVHMDVTGLEDAPITDETSDILAQADALLAEIGGDISEPAQEPALSPAETAPQKPATKSSKKKPLRWDNIVMGIVIALFLVASALIVRQIYRANHIRTVHYIMVTETEGNLSIKVVSDVKDEKLTVICNGGELRDFVCPVEDGIALLEGVSPDTKYTFTVIIDGDFELTGRTTATHTTDP